MTSGNLLVGHDDDDDDDDNDDDDDDNDDDDDQVKLVGSSHLLFQLPPSRPQTLPVKKDQQLWRRSLSRS